MDTPHTHSNDQEGIAALVKAAPGSGRIRLLFNPDAGVKAGVSTTRGTTPEALRDLMARYRLGDELIVTASADQASDAARDAVQQGYDLVIAAGGDGTVATVAAELLDSETALGILPLGSVMNVARMLDLPRELDAAAAIIASGTTRMIDVGEADGQLFLEGGSIGLNAAIFREFQYLDAGRYRSLLTALWVLLRYRPARMVLHLDDQIVATRALMVAVANGPYTGLGFTVAPDARLDDGRFDVRVFQRFSRGQLFAHLGAIAFGRRRYSPKVATYRSKRVHVESVHPPAVSRRRPRSRHHTGHLRRPPRRSQGHRPRGGCGWDGQAVKLALVVVALVLLVVLLIAVAIVVGLVWWRRSAHGSHPGRSRADAAVFLRAHGDDPRLPGHLRRLAADPRTPSTARGLLLALGRYLGNPIVLAPDFVPILGQMDEVTIGSVLLWLSWRSLPLDVWEGAFPPATAPAARVETGGRLGQALRRYEQAGQHDRLLQALDQTLPEWPVASTLIQVARELLELEHSVTLARASGAPDAVTSRLTQEVQAVAGPLWRLADRLAAAAAQRVDSPRLQEELAREEEKLARLLPAIREARTGLAELTLADFGSADVEGRDAFRRAEGRFRALAATSRELQDLDRGETA